MEYSLAKYLLVLSPHEDLQNKILEVKQSFKEKYNPTLFITKSNITLVKFFTWEANEERIKQYLRLITISIMPFKVDLNGYGSFPTHTIYINVATKNAIQNLVKELRAAQRFMKSTDSKPHFITDPYITIFQKLTDDQYNKSWLDYSQQHFSGSFIATNMLLLKQKNEKMKYEVLKIFPFGNAMAIKQGGLFS